MPAPVVPEPNEEEREASPVLPKQTASAPQQEASPQKFLSQKDYRPTPYRDSIWETIGERFESCFLPLEMSVIQTESSIPDPMFEVFNTPHQGVSTLWHSSTGKEQESETLDRAKEPRLDSEAIAAELQRRFEEGFAAGVAVGKKEGQEEAAEQYELLCAKMEKVNSSVSLQIEEHFAKIEKEALRLSLEIAKKILLTTARIQPEYIHDVLRQAMSALGAGKPLRVRLSPEDHEFIEVIGLPSQLSAEHLGLIYVADETVTSGCIVETDFGEIDVQLETMWQQVKENIYGEQK